MKQDPFAVDGPRLTAVLDALDDPDCRAILEQLDEPMTASDLCDACDIPRSTMYRKLDLLSEASLLEERIEINPNGRHPTCYAVGFDEVRVALDDDRSLTVEVDHRRMTPEERLSELWSEVRREL
ncbi:helix-turn-helix domain-containing protein [Halomarina halobia]|uniref:Helix-turn-helix domain-containing protein n=1 Tax=Halomarina halobia TaxID=3033386 RepID=A0ABD6ADG0_9EURY|nr:helix-turn-helix domain-containing protein [Halomarina sp. PSR21]